MCRWGCRCRGQVGQGAGVRGQGAGGAAGGGAGCRTWIAPGPCHHAGPQPRGAHGLQLLHPRRELRRRDDPPPQKDLRRHPTNQPLPPLRLQPPSRKASNTCGIGQSTTWPGNQPGGQQSRVHCNEEVTAANKRGEGRKGTSADSLVCEHCRTDAASSPGTSYLMRDSA